MQAITVSTWGRSGLGDIRVRVADGESQIEAATRSIARRTGHVVCTCRADSQSPDSTIYQATLGDRIDRRYGGGYSVEGEIWFSIPRGG